jgi:hypothetical protein
MKSLAGFFVLIFSAAAMAQSFVEVDLVDAKDIDPTTEQGAFGTLVRFAGDGRTVLATARFRNDPSFSGSQNGSVYSFHVQSNGMLQLQQTLEPGARNQFGRILAADGEWAAIGESGDRVRMYRLVNNTWTETQQLRISPDVPATPGVTVRSLDSSAALSGNLLAIGDATTNISTGGITRSNAGSVVLFRRNANNQWVHEATLIAPLPGSSSGFGEQVAISGDTLLVGAPVDSIVVDGSSLTVGGAYLYRRSAGSWNHVRTLRDPDPVLANRRFGWSVALENDIAVVGCASCGQPEALVNNTGALFTYRRDLGGSNAWGLLGKTVSASPVQIDEFSIALSLRDGVLLVGSARNRPQGASFWVRGSTGQWTQHSVLPSSAANAVDYGTAVDFFGATAVIGAPRFPNTSTSARWGAISSWYSRSIASCRGNFDAIFCDRFETLATP